MKFNDVKSETLNLRVSPTFKLALKQAAEHEQRSMVNMLEVLLGEYCQRKKITADSLEARDQEGRSPARRAHG